MLMEEEITTEKGPVDGPVMSNEGLRKSREASNYPEHLRKWWPWHSI